MTGRHFGKIGLLVLLVGMVTQGCVSTSTHEKVVQLNREQASIIRNLTERNNALKDAIDQGLDKIGNLSEERLVAKGQVQTARKELREIQEEFQALVQKLKDGKISMGDSDEGPKLVMAGELLFDSGKDKLKAGGMAVLDKVAEIVKGRKVYVRVDGHSDSDPIKHSRSRWQSNWHLSGARSRRVLEYLEKQGVSSGQLYFTGFSMYRPVESNDTRAGKAKNRRVEILIPKRLFVDSPIQPSSGAVEPIDAEEEGLK